MVDRDERNRIFPHTRFFCRTVALTALFLLPRPAYGGILDDLPPARTVAYFSVVEGPEVFADGDLLLLTWQSWNPTSTFFARSTDRGSSWLVNPVDVPVDTKGRPSVGGFRTRGLATLDDGRDIFPVFGGLTLHMMSTPDGGASWNAYLVATVSPSPLFGYGMEHAVSWTDGRGLVLVWYTVGSSYDSDRRELHMLKSTDGGLTYGADRTIATFPDGFRFPRPRIDVDYPRIRIVLWGRFTTELYYMESSDGGATWFGPNLLAADVYEPAGSLYQEEHVAVAGWDDRVVIGYSIREEDGSLNPPTKYRILRSEDGGRTVSDNFILPEPIDFHWREGVNLFALSKDHFLLLYSANYRRPDLNGYAMYDIFAQESFDGGLTWGDPVRLTAEDGEYNWMTHARLSASGDAIWVVSVGEPRFSPGQKRLLLHEIPICNTPVGTNVRFFGDGAVAVFDEVTACGMTDLTRDASGPDPGRLYPVTGAPYVHLTTSASTRGGVEVEIGYADAGLSPQQVDRLGVFAWDAAGNFLGNVTKTNLRGETIVARLDSFADSATLLLAVPPIRWDVEARPDKIWVDKAGDVRFVLDNFLPYVNSWVDLGSIEIDGDIRPYEVTLNGVKKIEARVYNDEFRNYPLDEVVTLEVTGRMFDGTPAYGTVEVIFKANGKGGGGPKAQSFSPSGMINAIISALQALLQALFAILGKK